ncbi:MAG TPA: lytic transglycosylase domain-containing protein [Candidatus Binatia bacterium]|nr:lytic transglycosylase domain-containing protein [Candidatus Binatia bacterium]
MTIHALALAALIRHCARAVAPSTMAAIVQVKSGGDPFAIGDNTTRRSYYPHDRASAESLARRLLDSGHLLDVGIAQIDSMNFAGFGVTAHTIFDPCINLNVGARILNDDYAFAAQRYGDGQIALRHAIGMYNTGRLNAGARYIARVLAAAGIQEDHSGGSRVISQRDAMRSPLLVRVAIVRRALPTSRRGSVTPARSPILVTVARMSRVKIF